MYASDLSPRAAAPWGLGRISHRAKGISTYSADSNGGSGSRVYVVDTGIYVGHSVSNSLPS